MMHGLVAALLQSMQSSTDCAQPFNAKNHIDKFRESRSIIIACQPNQLPSSCYALLVQAKPHSHYKHVANHPHDPLNVLKSEGSKHVNAHAAQGRIQPFCLGSVGPQLTARWVKVWLDPDGWERRDVVAREKIRPGSSELVIVAAFPSLLGRDNNYSRER